MTNKMTLRTTLKGIVYLLITVLLLGGCGDSPFSPGKNGTGDEPNPPDEPQTFGLVEVTISGIGTPLMRSSAHSVASDFSSGNMAAAFTGLSSSIQPLKFVRNGSFIKDGMRYLWTTFRVRNAAADSTAYNKFLYNLTFLAVDTDETYGKSAVDVLRLFDGTVLSGTDADAIDIAEATIPTGRVSVNPTGGFDLIQTDVLQVFTEAEVASVPDVPSGVTDIFPYGFITRSPGVTPGHRALTFPPSENQFDGLVTFAFKMPVQSQANKAPFEISMLFLPYDNDQTLITQSIQEQTPEGLQALVNRVQYLSADVVTILPGSSYRGVSNLMCGPVRVAGQTGDITPLFPAPPVFTSLSPNPYATDGSSDDIDLNSVFSATFSGPVSNAGASTFVVHGSFTGTRYIGFSYTGNNSNTVSVPSPTPSLLPGELVEVSLTPGLGICPGRVARYRVEVKGTGTGNFSEASTPPAGNEPRYLTAGDWDGDRDLDLAVANRASNDVSILKNNGSGTFSKVSTTSVGTEPYAVTAGDWDGDGDLDLAVANLGSDNVSILENNGAGAFTEASTAMAGDQAYSVTAGDWDSDGDLDLAVANWSSSDVSILENDGSGKFSKTSTLSVGSSPESLTAGDWDSDSDLDLAVMITGHSRFKILVNDGTGAFSASPGFKGGGSNPTSVTAGDWNGDGDLDLAVANRSSDDVSILKNDGSGNFSEAVISVGNTPRSVTSGDWDGDGDLDLAVANRGPNTVSILDNNGSGIFSVVSTPLVGGEPFSVTAGDWDGDNDLDLAVVNRSTDNVSVLINNP